MELTDFPGTVSTGWVSSSAVIAHGANTSLGDAEEAGVSVCELRRPRLDVLNELFWRRGEFNYVRANRKFARFISESHTSC